MYGKNLIFKTGGVDGCDCDETLQLIADGKINTEPLITHTYPLSKIDEAYDLFENKRDSVIKVAVECWHQQNSPEIKIVIIGKLIQEKTIKLGQTDKDGTLYDVTTITLYDGSYMGIKIYGLDDLDMIFAVR